MQSRCKERDGSIGSGQLLPLSLQFFIKRFMKRSKYAKEAGFVDWLIQKLLLFSALGRPGDDPVEPDLCSGSGATMLLLHHHQQVVRVQQHPVRRQPILPSPSL